MICCRSTLPPTRTPKCSRVTSAARVWKTTLVTDATWSVSTGWNTLATCAEKTSLPQSASNTTAEEPTAFSSDQVPAFTPPTSCIPSHCWRLKMTRSSYLIWLSNEKSKLTKKYWERTTHLAWKLLHSAVRYQTVWLTTMGKIKALKDRWADQNVLCKYLKRNNLVLKHTKVTNISIQIIPIQCLFLKASL